MEHAKDEDELLEFHHFLKVLNTFKAYRSYSLKTVTCMNDQFNKLPNRHKELIPNYIGHLNDIKECIEKNDELIQLVVGGAKNMFEHKKDMCHQQENDEDLGRLEVDKVYSTLKQVVREWGEEGREERKLSYGVVVEEIIYLLGNRDREKVSILVPGVGLGRLAYDLAQLGFSCQGNEFSLFMLIMSNFIINQCLNCQQYCIFPWVHETTNCLHHTHQLRSATIPDIQPSLFHSYTQTSSNHFENNLESPLKKSPNHPESPTHITCIDTQTSSPTSVTSPHNSQPSPNPYSSSTHPSSPNPSSRNFSIVAGDFLQVFTRPASWDCVATVFFLDTSHNILSYIETIYNILKPGAYWVNFGPLLYHFANTDDSLELPYDHVRNAIRKIGFKILKEQSNMPCTYNNNPPSMLTQQYQCVFFVAQKPLSIDP